MGQDTIEKKIVELKREVDAIKGSQTTNYKSIVSKKTWSANQYDVYVRLNATNQYYRLTVTSASGSTSALNMKYFYRWNNPDVMAAPYYPQPTAPEVVIKTLPDAPTVGSMSWQFRIQAPLSGFPPPYDVYIKFLFEGTDNFTFTWQQI